MISLSISPYMVKIDRLIVKSPASIFLHPHKIHNDGWEDMLSLCFCRSVKKKKHTHTHMHTYTTLISLSDSLCVYIFYV